MHDVAELIAAIRCDLSRRLVPESVSALSERLSLITIGLRQQVPVAFRETRMFRIRGMSHKPSHLHEIGAPPSGMSPMGRLNEKGDSVLYLADSPDTAFAESRASPGEFCLSEWRVQADKLAMANGGIPSAAMAIIYSQDIYEGPGHAPVPTAKDEEVMALLREIYTLDVSDDPLLYRWSIACAQANGFSHLCERNEVKELSGVTKWSGRYPFAAIAYPSIRSERTSINFAVNDRGRLHVRPDHVQWVRRASDGAHTSLDFSNSCDADGRLAWSNRPAKFLLKPKEGVTLVKIADNEWRYETPDGSIPWFA